MGLAFIGTMTGPLLKVLGIMPRAIFAGVFFVVGISRLSCPQIMDRNVDRHCGGVLLSQIPIRNV